MTKDNQIVKEITGRTLEECKMKLRREYGEDWELINQRTEFKPGGFLNLSTKEYIVVKYITGRRKSIMNEPESYNISTGNKLTEQQEFEKNRQALLQQNSDILQRNNTRVLAEMAEKLDELSEQLKTVNNKVDSNQLVETHETISKISEILSENEFSYAYIKMIEEKIRSKFSLEQLDDYKLVQRQVVDWIGESIEISKEKVFRPPHVVILVGPTGVGKTTTIAKLASRLILESKKNELSKPEICLITTDTMRVSAQEQLEVFANILGKNVLKAESSDDLRSIYDEYKEHVDYIFIDTSGYSPNDATKISNMKTILDVKMNADVYLAISASTKTSDLNNILRNYEPFAYESVIITKFDETQQIGNVISVLWEKHKTISYITDGQHVPRNIQKADVIEILKNLSGFDIDRIHIENQFGE
ncbi:MAG: AAA family ATPase [Treponema sp.]|nr:AAA family ATPase [Treponema sp.]